ncbi:hypothetical protein WSM22_47560 [Cytophagales bacterium WSM2-2]|nr:hypothetical protein WSM22_47560 [Cytophagales bacterium WSM2-2]
MIFQLFNEVVRKSVFTFTSKYTRPELLMAGMYLILWQDSMFMGEKTMNGLMWGMFMEFALAHAHTGTAVVGLVFPANRPSGRVALVVISLFYLLFVAGISFAQGSILSALLFILLSVKRIFMPAANTDFFKEILYAFFKVMIFLLSGAAGFLLAKIVPADIPNVGTQTGAEAVPAWGVCYFISLYFYENKMRSVLFPEGERKNKTRHPKLKDTKVT